MTNNAAIECGIETIGTVKAEFFSIELCANVDSFGGSGSGGGLGVSVLSGHFGFRT